VYNKVYAHGTVPSITLHLSTYLASCLFPGFIATELESCIKPFENGKLFLEKGVLLHDQDETICLLQSSLLTIESLVDLAFRMEVLDCNSGLLIVEEQNILEVFSLAKAHARIIVEELAPIITVVFQKKGAVLSRWTQQKERKNNFVISNFAVGCGSGRSYVGHVSRARTGW
jgi:hypothetical protein